MRAVNWSPETRIEQWRNRPSSFPQSQLFERGLALMKNFTRRSTIAGVATLALVGTGIAFAAWTSTGTGSGTADATNAVNLTVNVGNATGLYPTGSKTATFTVTNPNPYAVKLTGADAATNFGVDAGHSGCNVSSLSSAAQSLTDVIAAGATSSSHTVTISMDNIANDFCQGANFTFDLTVHGASN